MSRSGCVLLWGACSCSCRSSACSCRSLFWFTSKVQEHLHMRNCSYKHACMPQLTSLLLRGNYPYGIIMHFIYKNEVATPWALGMWQHRNKRSTHTGLLSSTVLEDSGLRPRATSFGMYEHQCCTACDVVGLPRKLHRCAYGINSLLCRVSTSAMWITARK